MLSLTDSYAVKILLCFFLKQVDRPVTPNQLTEIATADGIINYFYYTEAINSLLEAKTISLENINGEDFYVLSEKGKDGADSFKTLVPKLFRNKILESGLKLFAKLKFEKNVSCTVEIAEKGYIVHCICNDMDIVLMELKLFAPDKEQAELLREKILKNPSDFYGNVLDYALKNKDYEPDIIES
jgi:hypothetical protein